MKFLAWETGYVNYIDRFLYSIPFTVGVLFGAIMLSTGFKRRKLFFLRFLLCLILCYAAEYFLWPLAKTYISNTYFFSIYLAYFIFFGLVFGALLFCYDIRPFLSLFYTVNGISAYCIVKFTFYCTGAVILAYGLPVKPYTPLYLLIDVAEFAVIYILLWFMFVKKTFYKDMSDLDKKQVIIPAVIVIISITFGDAHITALITNNDMGLDAAITYKVLLILCNVLTLCLSFNIFLVGKKKREAEIIEEINRQKIKQFEISSEMIKTVNIKFHDLKKQITFLRKVSDGGVINALLDKLENEISEFHGVIKSGSDVLDIILSEKMTYCLSNGIKLSVSASGADLSFMDTMNIVSLFENILDNAIEASLKIADEAMRVISFDLKNELGLINVRCDNFFEGKLIKRGETFVTTKDDVLNHGYGLKSINAIVVQYGGVIKIEILDNLFSLSVAIPVYGK